MGNRTKQIAAILTLSWLGLAEVVSFAAEFEILDKFSVDGYTVLRGSADIPGGSFTVGASTFVVKGGNVGIGIINPVAKLQIAKGTQTGTYGNAMNATDLALYTGDGGQSDTYMRTGGGSYGSAGTSNLDIVTLNKNYTLDSGWRITAGSGAGEAINNGYLAFSKLRFDGTIYSPYEAMRIDTTGNVGIGTTAPGINTGDKTLTISGANPYLELNATGGSHAQLRFYNNGVYKGGVFKTVTDDIVLTSTSGKQIGFSVDSGGSNVVTIAANTGNVGIGTTNPVYKLDVSGASRFSDTINLPGIQSNYIYSGTGDDATYSTYNFVLHGHFGMALQDGYNAVHGVYDFRTGNLTTDGVAGFKGVGNNYFIGNVGIGTTGPTLGLLQVGDGTGTKYMAVSGVNGDIYVGSSNNNAHAGVTNAMKILASSAGNPLVISNNQNAPVVFGTSDLERMRILGNGNIGIGTTNPSQVLHIMGTVLASTGFRVGTSGTYKLVTNGDATLGYFIRSGAWKGTSENNVSLAAEGGFDIRMYTNGSAAERLVIDTSGNVGIGTASPAAMLDVQGTTRQSNLTTYVKTISAPGASPVTFTILRQFHDSVNWSVGGILIEEFTHSYDASRFDYGMYFARYGYSGNTADVLTKISGCQLPFWGAATQISGTYYYRDLSITVPAYYNMTIRITSPIGITTNLNGAQANVIYLY